MQEHETVTNLFHLTLGQTDCNSYPSIGMIPCALFPSDLKQEVDPPGVSIG